MKKIKKKLQKIEKFKNFATERAIELIDAKGYNIYNGSRYNFYFTSIEYNSDNIDFDFKEETRHDCPETGNIRLWLSDLEMTDEEWKANIIKIKNTTINTKKEKEKQAKRLELARKEEMIRKLKKELGYDN